MTTSRNITSSSSSSTSTSTSTRTSNSSSHSLSVPLFRRLVQQRWGVPLLGMLSRNSTSSTSSSTSTGASTSTSISRSTSTSSCIGVNRYSLSSPRFGRLVQQRWGVPLLGVIDYLPLLSTPTLGDLEGVLGGRLMSAQHCRNKHYSTEEVEVFFFSVSSFMITLSFSEHSLTH